MDKLKKTGITVLVICIICTIAYADTYIRWRTALTGGAANALDGIASPAAGDLTIVVSDITTTSPTFYLYAAVSGTTAGESSPDRILPDTNANAVLWWLVKSMQGIVSAPSGTGFTVIYTAGTLSVVSVGTNTTSLLGVDENGTIGLYNSLILSTGSITGTSIFTEQTCAAGDFMVGLTSSGTISCATP